jgi:hypothetical protein
MASTTWTRDNAAAIRRDGDRRASEPAYRILTTPPEPLAARVRNVWDRVFHAIPFPKGWDIRWADLSQWKAIGLTVWSEKLLLFDERAHQSPQSDLSETILHELTHLAHPTSERHGPGFAETLKRLRAYVDPREGHGAPGLATASVPRTRPEEPAGQTRMSPQTWFKVAELRQQIRNEEIATEQAAARAIDTMQRAQMAKVEKARETERAAMERRERDGIALYARASNQALAFWKMFVAGRELVPGRATLDEQIGKQLYGYFPSGRPSVAARHARFERTGDWPPL